MDNNIKELIVVSGKGGTGKTSIAASFAALHKNSVCADCDVDASDLHLLLKPRILHQEEFVAGHMAQIRAEDCTGCGNCMEVCRFDAPHNGELVQNSAVYSINEISCEGCGVCVRFCPEKAIDFIETVSGEWFVSETRAGPMVHARLGIAQENSGKLVTIIRKQARKIAEERGQELVIIDGSPGIGCPVIASMTNTDMALLVAEATISGFHDLMRVTELAAQLDVRAAVCVNKWDLNEEMTLKIESMASQRNVILAGRVRYDRNITHAQIDGQSIVESTNEGAAFDIQKLWATVISALY